MNFGSLKWIQNTLEKKKEFKIKPAYWAGFGLSGPASQPARPATTHTTT
jgi:hypothetical protein